jgi:hypothetical protein
VSIWAATTTATLFSRAPWTLHVGMQEVPSLELTLLLLARWTKWRPMRRTSRKTDTHTDTRAQTQTQKRTHERQRETRADTKRQRETRADTERQRDREKETREGRDGLVQKKNPPKKTCTQKIEGP